MPESQPHDGTEKQTPTPRRAALIFIFVTFVLDMLALGMIVPVLPKLVEPPGGVAARRCDGRRGESLVHA